ncbi:MAG: hypothetical protein JWN15_1084, partial [Firmicutes bacterium]|nr:hypothetical protein [Bacillota bacterium]
GSGCRLVMRVMWVLATERGRIHRLMAQPPADNGSERSKNEP